MSARWWLPVVAALLLGGGWWLNTFGNQFAYYYHPDEARKVRQVLTGMRNFNHPLLMLSSVEWVWEATGRRPQNQRVVELGRSTSAIFCALGTVAFFLAAWCWAGPVAAVTTGLFLTLHHQVFELAHYMKEDPSLYFGVGLFCLALVHYSRKQDALSVIAVGAAVGVAASAKYLGAILLIPSVAAILIGGRSEEKSARKGHAILMAAAAVVIFAVINWRLFGQWGAFSQSFGKEMDLVATGQGDVTRSVPHAIYLNIFVKNTTPVVWVLLIASFVALWRRPRAESIPGIIVATAVGWLLLMSFSPKTNDRYFLPLTGLFYVMAGTGAAFLWETTKGWRRAGLVVVLAAGLVWEGAQTSNYARAFSRDDRAELAAWIRENIPTSDTIAYDARVNLPDEEVYHDLRNPLPHRLLREQYVADVAEKSDGFAGEKIKYVVVSESTYGRFFLESLRPKDGLSAEFERRAAFYRKLREQKPLWSRPRGTVLYLHPGLEVYAVGS
ncbi:MAG TPA: glycosyltransferase family 39 protein [Chthoniobacterales bacterium]